MEVININEAKTHLSKLIEKGVHGEPFFIAKAGKPLVKVVALDAPTGKTARRMGFLKGQIKLPDNFDTVCSDEIEELFYGGR